MSRYAVRIVGPAGRATYLTADFNATQYESAAKTYRAVEDAEANGRIFRQERGGNFIWDVVNLDDPEATVP